MGGKGVKTIYSTVFCTWYYIFDIIPDISHSRNLILYPYPMADQSPLSRWYNTGTADNAGPEEAN
jgi:hypothetical protein